MAQIAYVQSGDISVQIELPEATSEVIHGVPWGDVSGFPTLAYWTFRVFERRFQHKTIQYKLGTSLREEIAACLLGGHGIPASMGIAAFEHLKNKGAFSGEVLPENIIQTWLSEPIYHKGKFSRYRFAGQKAKYLHSSMLKLAEDTPPTSTGKELRDWLLSIKGIGPKTASWIARNWLDANDVAILDIHIFRAGVLAKFFDPKMSVEKNYFELEKQFIDVAKGLNVEAAELDAVMWYEMQNSSRVRGLLAEFLGKKKGNTNSSTSFTDERNPEPHQIALV